MYRDDANKCERSESFGSPENEHPGVISEVPPAPQRSEELPASWTRSFHVDPFSSAWAQKQTKCACVLVQVWKAMKPQLSWLMPQRRQPHQGPFLSVASADRMCSPYRFRSHGRAGLLETCCVLMVQKSNAKRNSHRHTYGPTAARGCTASWPFRLTHPKLFCVLRLRSICDFPHEGIAFWVLDLV